MNELQRFVPAVAAEWQHDAGDSSWQEIDATMCFVDISGFTNLSEKLAQRGRIGAEELTEVLSRVFGSMIALAYERGGGLLKFGGDALLLLFRGPDHVMQGCSAAVEMRAALRESAKIPTSVGQVPLRMSVGLHTGPMHLFLVGGSHRELIVTGPGATGTIDMEGTADPGEIVVSTAVRDALPPSSAPRAKGEGWLLKWRRAPIPPSGARPRGTSTTEQIETCVPVVLRNYLHQGPPEPEHRVGVVAFVKYKGVDQLHADRGPTAVAAALDQLVRVVQNAVDTEAVTFLASDIDADGGKFILTTGVPGSHEDDERRMLRALRLIADAHTPLAVKVGVNRGHVFAGEVGAAFRSTYTVMGDTVNLAARLMAAAPAGQLYAAPDVLDRSLTLFEAEALPPFMVKGKEKPVQAYLVGAELGPREDGFDAERGELPFHGRSNELETLTRHLCDDDHFGGAVTVVGSAGAGKTRLVSEALAGRALATLPIRGEPYGTAAPYRAFRDAARTLLGVERGDNLSMTRSLRASVRSIAPHLEPLLPLLGAVLHITIDATATSAAIEPQFRQDRIADVVLELAELVAPGPAILLVEDSHWMDEASSHLLARLRSVAARNNWLVIATRREGTDGFTPADADIITLGPIDEGAAREIVNSATAAAPLRPHEVDTIVERCAGNPLFLRETITAARDVGSVDELPDSLNAVVSGQIDALEPLARRMLRYAAVLGASLRIETLEEMIASESLELNRSTRAELADFLQPDGDEHLQFKSSVVRDVAYDGLSYRRRRELHRRAADAIQRGGRSEVESIVDSLSFHCFEGQQWDETWRFARLAGQRAQANAANTAAAAHYNRALESSRRVSELDDKDLADVWGRLGDVLEAAGHFDDALESYDRAAKLVRDQPLSWATMTLRRARAQERAGHFDAAMRTTARARSKIQHDATPEARQLDARLLSFRATIRVAQEQPRKALDLALEAMHAARSSGEREGLGRACYVVDYASRVLGKPLDTPYALEALGIYEELADLQGQAIVLGNLGFEAYFTGDWDEAIEYNQRAVRTHLRLGNTVGAAIPASSIGEILVCQRRAEEARRVLTDAARTMRASGFDDGATFAEIQLARADMVEGLWDDAIVKLDLLIDELTAIGLLASALEASIYRAECDLHNGDAALALLRLEEARASAGDDAAIYAVSADRIAALAHSMVGRTDVAVQLVEHAIGDAREQGLAYDLSLLLEAHDFIGGGGPSEARAEAAELRTKLGISSS